MSPKEKEQEKESSVQWWWPLDSDPEESSPVVVLFSEPGDRLSLLIHAHKSLQPRSSVRPEWGHGHAVYRRAESRSFRPLRQFMPSFRPLSIFTTVAFRAKGSFPTVKFFPVFTSVLGSAFALPTLLVLPGGGGRPAPLCARVPSLRQGRNQSDCPPAFTRRCACPRCLTFPLRRALRGSVRGAFFAPSTLRVLPLSALVVHRSDPVSYTHLTLPTKRIV